MLAISPFQFRLFLWRYLPTAIWMGLRLELLDDQICTIGLRYRWRNRNPFGSIYFAAQAAASELSTGLPAFLEIRRIQDHQISMLVMDIQMTFLRQAKGKVYFRFDQIHLIRNAILRAKGTDDPQFCALTVIGLDALTGAQVSNCRITWRFRRRKTG